MESSYTRVLANRRFFVAAMFMQNFDEVMLPPKTHILGTPNRAG